MLVRRFTGTLLLTSLFFLFSQTVYAQQYYYTQPVYNPYTVPVYSYNQTAYDPNYDPYYSTTSEPRSEKIKRALKYAAIGAGAGYFLSGESKKKKNALIGGGVGAALGYFLGR